MKQSPRSYSAVLSFVHAQTLKLYCVFAINILLKTAKEGRSVTVAESCSGLLLLFFGCDWHKIITHLSITTSHQETMISNVFKTQTELVRVDYRRHD